MLVTQLCPTPCDPMDCSLPGSSVHGILQGCCFICCCCYFCWRLLGSLFINFKNSAIGYVTSGRTVNPLCVCEREKQRERQRQRETSFRGRSRTGFLCLGSWAIDCVWVPSFQSGAQGVSAVGWSHLWCGWEMEIPVLFLLQNISAFLVSI